MKRPRQHEIDTRAQRFFQSLLPDSWVLREQHPDYGLDYDVDIFVNGQPTGISFSVQLKGTTSPRYENESIALSFEVDKLIYYFQTVRRPVFIVVADLANKKCFWLLTQRYIHQTLRKQTPQWFNKKSVTLHVPTTNQLPETTELLQKVAEEGLQEVLILQIGRPTLRQSLEIQDKLYDKKAISEAIRESELEADSLKLGLVDMNLEEGNTQEALRELWRIFEDTKSQGQPETHIMSAIKLVYTLDHIDKKVNRQCAYIIDLALKRGDECKFKHVVLVARGLRAFLDFLSSFYRMREWGIFIKITEPQERGADALLRVLQSEELEALVNASNNMHQLVSEAIDTNQLSAATDILIRIAMVYLITYPFVRLSDGKEKAQSILEYASEKIEFAKKIAESLRNPELVCYVLQTEAHLLFLDDNPEYGRVLLEMRDIAKSNKLPHFQKAAASLSETFKKMKHLPEEPKRHDAPAEMTEEEEVAVIRKLAEFTGVDLSDENDEIAQMINLGIRDKNPERVLKFCHHLHWVITSCGLPGELFGLPTAGGKLLYCDLKERAIGGMSLDEILEILKRQHCESCQHRLPRPKNWRWSRQWQYEQDKNRPQGLQRILDNLYGRHG